MAITFDVPVLTSVSVQYVHKGYHRNGNPQKSQWTIPPRTEINVFERTYRDSQGLDPILWGLLINNGNVMVVGISCSARPPKRRLKISRFNSNTSPYYWYGYPADYQLRHQDRPPLKVLKNWMVGGIITKAEGHVNRQRSTS